MRPLSTSLKIIALGLTMNDHFKGTAVQFLICTFTKKLAMSGFLFNDIIFGPVKSRRFGVSLGVNLLPETMKYCTFNCIYCECGLTDADQDKKAKIPSAARITEALSERFAALSSEGLTPDNITFAGNGEPTIHPGFAEIVDRTIELRNLYFPKALITVLSNSTRLHIVKVKEALLKLDNNVLKLDAGSQEMFDRINRPLSPVKLESIVGQLAGFGGNLTIQTLFVRGLVDGCIIDNTSETEISLWIGHLLKIKPKLVMLYSIDRGTPERGLEKIGAAELNLIAERLAAQGIPSEVFA